MLKGTSKKPYNINAYKLTFYKNSCSVFFDALKNHRDVVNNGEKTMNNKKIIISKKSVLNLPLMKEMMNSSKQYEYKVDVLSFNGTKGYFVDNDYWDSYITSFDRKSFIHSAYDGEVNKRINDMKTADFMTWQTKTVMEALDFIELYKEGKK
uniref:Phage protein n=1 Tax=Parastrongyloides trichosuri TaxID=131310 RepID=A0A0N4Z056_PARTI